MSAAAVSLGECQICWAFVSFLTERERVAVDWKTTVCTPRCARQWRCSWWSAESADLLSLGGGGAGRLNSNSESENRGRGSERGFSEGGVSRQSDADEGWFCQFSETGHMICCLYGGEWEESPDRLISGLTNGNQVHNSKFSQNLKVFTFCCLLLRCTVYFTQMTTTHSAAEVRLKDSSDWRWSTLIQLGQL